MASKIKKLDLFFLNRFWDIWVNPLYPAEFSDFAFDTLHEILQKRIWHLILSPCPIFRYLIHFRARSKIFFSIFIVQDNNLVGCGLSSEIGVFNFILFVGADFSLWHSSKSTQTIVDDQCCLLNGRSRILKHFLKCTVTTILSFIIKIHDRWPHVQIACQIKAFFPNFSFWMVGLSSNGVFLRVV